MNKQALKNGILPGLIATLCCLGPLLFIMLGLISASTALSFTTYNRYFIPLGIIILIVTLWYFIRKKKQLICGACTTKEQERQKIIFFVVFSVAAAVVTYLFVFYIVLPWLAPIIFENFYRGKQ